MNKELLLSNKLTTVQLAEELRINRGTLDKWRCLGTGPPYTKICARCYYDKTEVMEWIQSHRVQTQG